MRRLISLSVCLFLLCSCTTSNKRRIGRIGPQASTIVRDSQQEHRGDLSPGPHFSEQIGKRIAAQIVELEEKDPSIHIPLNDSVKASVEYFLTDARKFMIRSLGRSTKYIPMMQDILRKKGLPPDLAYMVLIESGFRVDAISPARAGGQWQFIPATGKRYGLRINDLVDERMDPVKSTHAAADYLTELYAMFDCWYLATAGYNAGEGKIIKGINKYNTSDFWEIAEENFLHDETKGYVPKLLAAILIAKDPERYGLSDISYEEPWVYDEVTVFSPTDLEVIARLAGTDLSEIEDLNPHLKGWCTPLEARDYVVRVPRGAGADFEVKYANTKPAERMRVSVHTVQSGESLRSIAKRFGLSASTLQRFNNLKRKRLKKGQKIKLPVDTEYYLAHQRKYKARLAADKKRLEKSGNKAVYIVRPGDSPWQIARNYDLNWRDIAAWNNIKDVKKLRPGRKLVLYLDADDGPSTSGKKTKTYTGSFRADTNTDKTRTQKSKNKVASTYTVKKGDTIWKIALHCKMNPDDLRAMNKLKNDRIRAGQKLRIAGSGVTGKAGSLSADKKNRAPAQKAKQAARKQPAESSKRNTATYMVQPDDTLWKISRKYNVRPEDIRAANGLKSNSIRPGEVLELPTAAASRDTVDAQSWAGGSTTATEVHMKETAPRQKDETESSKSTSGKVTTYTVKDGDSLWKIARRFKVSSEKIRSLNKLKNNTIRPGDVLTIKN